MEEEVRVSQSIQRYIDIVYGRTYFLETDQAFKSIIENDLIQLDYATKKTEEFSPAYDCLYYPTVSDTKCSNQFTQEDWNKFENELTKLKGEELPTFEIYTFKRLTNELCFFLKHTFQNALNPHFGLNDFGPEYFINQYFFIYRNFPADKKDVFKRFWVQVLENLKTDGSVLRLSFDGTFQPIGNFAGASIDELISDINNEKK